MGKRWERNCGPDEMGRGRRIGNFSDIKAQIIGRWPRKSGTECLATEAERPLKDESMRYEYEWGGNETIGVSQTNTRRGRWGS